MKILYFSTARVAAGCEEETILGERAVSFERMWEILIGRHPGLSTLRKTSRLSRNDEYADDATVFFDDDVVAVLPPVSGG